jgi:hypothetical protein
VGFSFHVLLKQCEDRNECITSNNPCGNARCQNSIGGYGCTCPAGYQYNGEMQVNPCY